MAYTHITTDQRHKIQSYLEIGMDQKDIAACLGKDKSAISREIKNNSYPNGIYNARHADKLFKQRRKDGKRLTKKLIKDKKLQRAVLRLLRKKKSPQQIAGRRERLKKDYVVHQTIYSYIYTERQELGKYLRRKRNRYRRRHGTVEREKLREEAKKRRIDERPAIIESRTEIGHWEGDTVVGKDNSGAIATHVERVSGYALATKMDRLLKEEFVIATSDQFRKVPKNKRITETLDNGKEMADFEFIEKNTGITIYFAYPHHSWERGSNENFNGLLREYFPKGTNFATITQKDVDRAVRELNHRPRKRLNYLTPYEVFIKGLKP